MTGVDLALLHAPSVYDFREQPAMHGPISDVVPSTAIFEMYPLGFVSMVGYLEQNGYRARIINLAARMLRNPSFDVENFIRRLDTKVYGFDIHWLPQAAGTLDLANLVKKYRPEAPILIGGLSSTYYHEEIIQYFPQVDYILRGDSTEKPLLDLMKNIEKCQEPENVENLTWRTDDNRKRVNPLNWVPSNHDELWIDYGEVVKMVLRHKDLESALPYQSFMEYPFTAVLTCKGCSYNCITCGGSCFAFKNFFNRDGPSFKTPDKLVEEMRIITEYFKAPIFLIGDLRQGGRKWAEQVLEGIKGSKFDNTITYELFDAVPLEWMRRLAGSTDKWTLEISPESHDDSVRKIMGKPYTTDQMEKTIRSALDHGSEKLDIYYMVGLSGQSPESALNTVEYTKRLYERIGHSDKIFSFIAPMAPFLDPGSKVFENPHRYGYIQLYRTLREHKEALYQPSWKLYLSYYTKWMSRDQIAETTYEAMIRMNRLKIKVGITDQKRGETVEVGLILARDIMRKIDTIIDSVDNQAERTKRYIELKNEIEEAKKSTGLAKRELRMPGLAGIRVKGVLRYLVKYLTKDG